MTINADNELTMHADNELTMNADNELVRVCAVACERTMSRGSYPRFASTTSTARPHSGSTGKCGSATTCSVSASEPYSGCCALFLCTSTQVFRLWLLARPPKSFVCSIWHVHPNISSVAFGTSTESFVRTIWHCSIWHERCNVSKRTVASHKHMPYLYSCRRLDRVRTYRFSCAKCGYTVTQARWQCTSRLSTRLLTKRGTRTWGCSKSRA
jgi:hypothetical protein